MNRNTLNSVLNRVPRRLVLWCGGILAVILVIIFAVAFFIDEPLRRKVERNMNERLKGYTVRLERLDFHPIGLSLDLEQLSIYQNPPSDQPIAHIPNLHASVHWKALLSGRLVGDFQFDDPTINFDLRQFEQEAKDATPIKEKGWQAALQAAYPLKIDRFAIRNGDVTYVDKGPYKPLHLTQVNFTAENIRNVESAEGVYPSPVALEGVVFEKGKARFTGNVDFLAQPHIALKGEFQLDDIALDYFRPIAERFKLSARSGSLSTQASIEVAPTVQKILISNLNIGSLDADYLHQETQTAPTERMTKEAGQVARKAANEPTLEVKVERVTADGRIGYINQAAKPPYSVFLEAAKLQVENLSNHFRDGPAKVRMTGKFMGSGATQAQATFRPEAKGPDFDLTLSIENTDMRKMNDLLRAYGNFDVVAGNFSMYSEIKIRQGKIAGYVKPLFTDMEVYDRRQDAEKSMFRKLYEGLIGGISGLLQNRPREEVATKVPISGDVEAPQTGTWQTVLGLIQNAFFKAILPGFEKEVSSSSGKRAAKPASNE
jgi:hypothetical protein